MEKTAAWQLIHGERAALGRMLGTLTPAQWERPSLCEGWSVRDVAAHVISWPDTTLRQTGAAMWRAGGDYNRMMHDEAQRRSARPTAQIVADFGRLAGSRHRPPLVTYHEALLDVLVHTQDIAIPLGLRRDIPLEAARDCAARTWRIGFPFYARKRLAGYRLVATDIDWSVGDGATVRGPIAQCLLLVTGRPVALQWLSGEGVAPLRQQMEAAPRAPSGVRRLAGGGGSASATPKPTERSRGRR